MALRRLLQAAARPDFASSCTMGYDLASVMQRKLSSGMQKAIDEYRDSVRECIRLLMERLECSEEIARKIFEQQVEAATDKKKSS